MIERILEEKITQRLDKGKAILVIGPRQVGKTTLINSNMILYLFGYNISLNAIYIPAKVYLYRFRNGYPQSPLKKYRKFNSSRHASS